MRRFQIVAYQFVISYHRYQAYCSSTVCVMDFSVKSVNSIEKEFNETFEIIRLGLKEAKVNNVNNADDLSPQILMKLNKEPLTKIVNSLAKIMKKSLELNKSAAGTIDDMKTENLRNQQSLITLQQKELGSVRETVKTEMESWTDIVKRNSKPAVQPVQNVKKVVNSVLEENERSKNFVVYGAVTKEGYGETNEELTDIVEDIFKELNEYPHPQILSLKRLGKIDEKQTESARPIKVTLASAEKVGRILSLAPKLKKSVTTEYKRIYLAPDRSADEMKEHKKLVANMKQLIISDSTKYHYIKNNKVMSVGKNRV